MCPSTLFVEWLSAHGAVHGVVVIHVVIHYSTESNFLFLLLFSQVGWANTLFWKANQWVMVHLYHCRMVLTYHMWWVWISNWNAMMANLGFLHFAVIFTGLIAVTVIFNPYWTYKKTMQLFSPVDWYFEKKSKEKCVVQKTE